MKNINSLYQPIVIYGTLGLLGALLVGIGECFLHYNPQGYGGDSAYSFLMGIGDWRIPWGHFLSVLPLPLYYLGYWQLHLILKKNSPKLSKVFFFLSVYVLGMAHVWIGSRAILIHIVHLNSSVEGLDSLLENYEFYYESLINLVRFGILITSILYIWMIWKGNSILPKWMVVFNPILLVVSSFLLYAIFPFYGGIIAPIAMNFAHIILFSLTTSLSIFYFKNQNKQTTKDIQL